MNFRLFLRIIGEGGSKLDKRNLILLTAGICLCLSLILWMIKMFLGKKQRQKKTYVIYRKEEWSWIWLLRSYLYLEKMPVLKKYIFKIRKRLSIIQHYDEYSIRKETASIVLVVLGVLGTGCTLLLILNQDPIFILAVLIAMFVTNGIMVDALIHRLENRLLVQLIHFLQDVRHHYYRYGVVEEAIEEAAAVSEYREISLHAREIVRIITAKYPDEELENYEEIAPNRFLKGFAGISYLIKEYGDKQSGQRSMYLQALEKLTQELHMENLRREKLGYLLKGLTSIAVIPVLFTGPIENWASNHFPAMEDFYASRTGFLAKLTVYAIILMSYLLLRHIQDQSETGHFVQYKKNRWEKRLYERKGVRWLVDRFIPRRGSKEHYRIWRLLQDTQYPIPMEWLYIRRIMLGCLSVFFALGLFIVLHQHSIHQIYYAPTKESFLFGRLSEKELEQAKARTEMDRNIINQLVITEGQTKEQAAAAVKQWMKYREDHPAVQEAAARILKKTNQISHEYLKWWEVLISLLVGAGCYNMPIWLLLFNRRMRKMELKNEVEQLHAILSILCRFERITVEHMLEWMERFARQFKPALKRCLLYYDSGLEKALEQLKLDASFQPFARTVERLQLAADKIPVEKAFDNLETERSFYQEQRKLELERIIDNKAGWGRIIGFTPMYTLVFLYLVIPLVYLSLSQMNVYYEQIHKIF